jgi:hypothetical protein
VLECLPSKHKILSSNPSAAKRENRKKKKREICENRFMTYFNVVILLGNSNTNTIKNQ